MIRFNVQLIVGFIQEFFAAYRRQTICGYISSSFQISKQIRALWTLRFTLKIRDIRETGMSHIYTYGFFQRKQKSVSNSVMVHTSFHFHYTFYLYELMQVLLIFDKYLFFNQWTIPQSKKLFFNNRSRMQFLCQFDLWILSNLSQFRSVSQNLQRSTDIFIDLSIQISISIHSLSFRDMKNVK